VHKAERILESLAQISDHFFTAAILTHHLRHDPLEDTSDSGASTVRNTWPFGQLL
jgi:hypothetical protein